MAFLVRFFVEQFLARRPGEFAACEQVQVKVGDFLAAVWAVVDDGAEAGLGKAFLLGDLLRGQYEVTKGGLIFRSRLSDAWDGLLGNQQQVSGSLRIDVTEAEAEIVFVDDVRRDFPGNDFLEESHGANGVLVFGEFQYHHTFQMAVHGGEPCC